MSHMHCFTGKGLYTETAKNKWVMNGRKQGIAILQIICEFAAFLIIVMYSGQILAQLVAVKGTFKFAF